MKLLQHCPVCGPGPRLFTGARPCTDREYVEVQRCPKCGWEQLGQTRPGSIGVENEWSVVLGFVRRLTGEELVRLRALHPSLQEIELSQLLRLSREQGELRVDDLSREQAVKLVEAGSKLGLACRIV